MALYMSAALNSGGPWKSLKWPHSMGSWNLLLKSHSVPNQSEQAGHVQECVKFLCKERQKKKHLQEVVWLIFSLDFGVTVIKTVPKMFRTEMRDSPTKPKIFFRWKVDYILLLRLLFTDLTLSGPRNNINNPPGHQLTEHTFKIKAEASVNI